MSRGSRLVLVIRGRDAIHTEHMACLLCVCLSLCVQAHFWACHTVVLGLQRCHSAKTGGLYCNCLRLCVWSQRLVMLLESNLELSSSLLVLQYGSKMFWEGSVQSGSMA